ncbi:MAG: TauD/TfdA family dioxygenase [Alphaproteobacteria bacterium]|nr:TauD/TfdA family dioxygenase [Alphaproteobacteria bacterium]
MASVQAYPFRISRISDVGGAEIFGVDLSQPLDAAMKDAIMRAFLEFHILVFRDQELTKDAQYKFSENFGEMEHHVGRLPNGKPYSIVHTVTNLDADGNPIKSLKAEGNYFWHTDKSYHAVPSLTTMLHAVELPESGGGDTQFANTKRGYDALSDTMKTRIADMKVEHSWEASRRNVGAPPPNAAQISERPPVVHPIVRTHPDTGDKTLYLGHHMSHIVGLDKDESDALLEELSDHTTQDEFVYTHQWRTGDYVMWDNRLLLHRAMPNYKFSKDRRLLHRTVVIGTAPY